MLGKVTNGHLLWPEQNGIPIPRPQVEVVAGQITLSLEQASNKVPQFSPSFGGGNMICSRCNRGGEGDALAINSR